MTDQKIPKTFYHDDTTTTTATTEKTGTYRRKTVKHLSSDPLALRGGRRGRRVVVVNCIFLLKKHPSMR
jgi:hypothetical protein